MDRLRFELTLPTGHATRAETGFAGDHLVQDGDGGLALLFRQAPGAFDGRIRAAARNRDRDAQFRDLNESVRAALAADKPVIEPVTWGYQEEGTGRRFQERGAGLAPKGRAGGGPGA